MFRRFLDTFQSNNNNTLPLPETAPSQKRASLDGGADDTGTGLQSRKKRKQEELDPVTPDTVASLSEPTIAPPTNTVIDNTVVPVPLTDEQQITLIVTTRLSSDNVQEAAKAMYTLAKLVVPHKDNANFEENRKIAFRRGALLAVVQTMRRHGISHKIQYLGISVLVDISFCKLLEGINQDIIAIGGLKYCLEAMNRHDTNAIIQSIGCCFIGWLFVNVRKETVDEGGLKAVIQAMDKNKEKISVQHWGCIALQKLLSRESSTWAKAAVDFGSIDLVIAAMNNHPTHAKLQLYGCDILRHLSKVNADYRKAILDGKGLVPVVEAQRIHNNDAKVVQTARNAYDAIIANKY